METAVDEATESAHWPLGDMREQEENSAHGLRQKTKKREKNDNIKCALLAVSKTQRIILLAVADPYVSLMVLGSCSLYQNVTNEQWGDPNNKYC